MPMPPRPTEVGVLSDLPDERRSKKAWLPQSDRDVSEGRVVLATYPRLPGQYPACFLHGALACVNQEGYIWRCLEQYCGLGAIYRRR